MAIRDLIIIFWLIFIGYWAITAFAVKKDISAPASWPRPAYIRITIFIILAIFLSRKSTRQYIASGAQFFATSRGAQIAGAILCALGIALAIWARKHLGSNWSPVPSEKENHELVISGPYKFLRHPIYTGLFTAAIGSALAGGILWPIISAALLIIFIRRIAIEEKIMTRLFTDKYSSYKKRTYALIPFIF